jgi:hypothetical protein
MISVRMAAVFSAVLVGPLTWPAVAPTTSDHVPDSSVNLSEPSRPHRLGVCFENASGDTGVALVSSNFLDPGFDMYDAVAADDVLIGESRCQARRLMITGTYFSGTGPAESENVVIYTDADGRPGRVVSAQTVVGEDRSGTYEIKLDPVKLRAGRHYWLSFQANIMFECCHMWGWENTSHGVGLPALWRNPGDGYDTGCVDWENMQDCFGGVAPGPDLIFTIVGRQSRGLDQPRKR